MNNRNAPATLARLDLMLAKVVETDPAGLEADIAAVVARRGTAEQRPRLGSSWAELSATPQQEPPWLIQALLPGDGCSIIGGEPKHQKSFLALDLGLAVASGQPFLGRRVPWPGPVYFLSTEDGWPRLRRRTLQFCRARGLDPGLLPLTFAPKPRDFSVTNAMCMATLENELAAIHPRLVILDAWRDLFDGDENQADVVSAAWRPIRRLSTTFKCAVVVVAHFGKSGSDRRGGQKLRGSSALHGKLDAGIYLVAEDQDSKILRAEFECRDLDDDAPTPVYLRLVDWSDQYGQRVSQWQVSQSHPKMLEKVASAIDRCKQEKGHAPSVTELRKIGGLQASYQNKPLADVLRELVAAGLLEVDNQTGKAPRFDIARYGQVFGTAGAANPTQPAGLSQQNAQGVSPHPVMPTPLPGGGGGFPFHKETAYFARVDQSFCSKPITWFDSRRSAVGA
jgi:hypothetical protein